MDPRVKPEDDEITGLVTPFKSCRMDSVGNAFVILGLDPRIHA